MKKDGVCKIVLLGDGGVGKTTLINRIIKKEQQSQLTPGLSVETKIIKTTNGKKISLVFWDFGGQPQFRFFQSDFLGRANFAVLVFDVTRYSSFNNLETQWYEMLKQANLVGKIKLILLGNKIDLGQTINDEVIQEFASKLNIPYLKVSGKTGENLGLFLQELKNQVSQDPSSYYPVKEQ